MTELVGGPSGASAAPPEPQCSGGAEVVTIEIDVAELTAYREGFPVLADRRLRPRPIAPYRYHDRRDIR